MNELDWQIAKLRGWRKPTVDDIIRIGQIELIDRLKPNYYNLVREVEGRFEVGLEPYSAWSTDIDKALTLLEEIPGGIDLSRVETGGWGIILKDHNLSSAGRTLAQAICHAYVAFKESTQRKPE